MGKNKKHNQVKLDKTLEVINNLYEHLLKLSKTLEGNKICYGTALTNRFVAELSENRRDFVAYDFACKIMEETMGANDKNQAEVYLNAENLKIIFQNLDMVKEYYYKCVNCSDDEREM